jgi:hypothetical protein
MRTNIPGGPNVGAYTRTPRPRVFLVDLHAVDFMKLTVISRLTSCKCFIRTMDNTRTFTWLEIMTKQNLSY